VGSYGQAYRPSRLTSCRSSAGALHLAADTEVTMSTAIDLLSPVKKSRAAARALADLAAGAPVLVVQRFERWIEALVNGSADTVVDDAEKLVGQLERRAWESQWLELPIPSEEPFFGSSADQLRERARLFQKVIEIARPLAGRSVVAGASTPLDPGLQATPAAPVRGSSSGDGDPPAGRPCERDQRRQHAREGAPPAGAPGGYPVDVDLHAWGPTQSGRV